MIRIGPNFAIDITNKKLVTLGLVVVASYMVYKGQTQYKDVLLIAVGALAGMASDEPRNLN